MRRTVRDMRPTPSQRDALAVVASTAQEARGNRDVMHLAREYAADVGCLWSDVRKAELTGLRAITRRKR